MSVARRDLYRAAGPNAHRRLLFEWREWSLQMDQGAEDDDQHAKGLMRELSPPLLRQHTKRKAGRRKAGSHT